jgi:hypothetical protein
LVFNHGVAIGFAGAFSLGKFLLIFFFVCFVRAVFLTVCNEVGFWLLRRELWWGGGIGVPRRLLANGNVIRRQDMVLAI